MRLRLLLGLLALGVIAAVLLESGQPADEGAPAPAAARSSSKADEPRAADLRLAERLQREKISEKVIGEPFGAPPPPPRPAAATARARAPVAPMATPFPYRYAGQISLPGGETQVYLTKGSELLLVKAGDVLEGEFRVTSVGEEALEVLHVATQVATLLQYTSLNADSSATTRVRRSVAAAQ
jgi:hypothetical protein